MTVERVVLGIGSNLDRCRHIQAAIDDLRSRFGAVRLSPVYESAAAGFEGPDFFNLVAIVETDLGVDALQDVLREIEDHEGRVRGDERFASRTLDIDILLYGDADLRTEGHDIPRDEILNYAFVLKPLADLLPEAIHPTCGETFAALWRRFEANQPGGGLSKSTWTPR